MTKTKLQTLDARRVAVLMADGFEMAEYTVPVNALRLAGADVTVVSLRRGRLRGVNLHEPAHKVRADLTIDEARADDFDALFIPGGFINPDLLRQSAPVRRFVSEFVRSGRPVASLCHGPWVLISSGVVGDRTLTAWPGIRDDVVNAGASWVDAPVVRDGNLLTSRGPQDFAEFVPALIDFFSTGAESRASGPEHVSSPQRDEPPAAMLATMHWTPRPSFRGFVLGALAVGGLAMIGQRAAR